MYKDENRVKHDHARKKKSLALLISLILLIAVAVGGTVAYLYVATDPIENKFTPSSISTTVVEDFDGEVKDNVKIENSGDTEAYIRASINVTWRDVEGRIYHEVPQEEVDYEIDFSGITAGDWFRNTDGFYYCKEPVAAGECTPVLFGDCQVMETAEVPDGYFLDVEILASGVQSAPVKAVTESWGVDPTTW